MRMLRDWFEQRRRPESRNHADVREQYDAFNDGMLSASETAAYQSHLRTCPACQQWVARQRALITDLRTDMPPPHRLEIAGAIQIQQAIYKQIRRNIFMQNMKRSLQTVAVITAVVLVVGVVLWWQFGRSDETTSLSETAVPTPTILANASAEAVKNLTFAAPAAQRSRYELVAALFNGLNPDVSVQVVTLSPDSDPATQADTAVLNLPPASATSYVNLADRLQASTDINPQDYFNDALQGCQAGDYAYGLPLSFAPSYLYFDQTVLAEAGVTVPTADWTWPDLVQTITALSSGDGTRYGFGNVDGLLRLLRPLIAANLDQNGTLNTAPLEPYLQDITNLVAAGHVADVAAADLETLIANGRIGLWLENPVTLSARQVELGEALGKLPVPLLGDLALTNATETACLTISRGSDQPEIAWRWLQFLAFNPPDLPPGNVPANRVVFSEIEANQLPANRPPAQALDRAWFSSQRSEVEALLPPLRQHVVTGLPLPEVLAQANAGAEAVVSTESGAEVAVPAIASPSPNTGPTVIHYYGDEFRLAEAINTFREAHPDIIVDVSLQGRLGTGGYFSMEDVADQFDCFSWFVAGETPEGLSEWVWDLSEWVPSETLADYAPETLTLLQKDGALLGLPLEVNPMVIRYNENRFNERGVPLPTADWSLSDMLNMAALLGQTGDTPSYGFVSTGFGILSGPEVIELLLLEQGLSPWDLAAGTVQLTDPAVTAVFNQYITWLQQNSLYATVPGEDSDERNTLAQNGRAALWSTPSDRRPFAIGIPEPLAMLPLPQLNSQILPAPWQTTLFISRQVEDPSACMQWLEFLTTRADAITAVPARQSVATSRSWQNEVGPENAAVFREALARHLAASTPGSSLTAFGVKYPLYVWLQEAAEAVVAGGDATAALSQAQMQSEQYLVCVGENTATTAEEFNACAEQTDPNYNSNP